MSERACWFRHRSLSAISRARCSSSSLFSSSFFFSSRPPAPSRLGLRLTPPSSTLPLGPASSSGAAGAGAASSCGCSGAGCCCCTEASAMGCSWHSGAEGASPAGAASGSAERMRFGLGSIAHGVSCSELSSHRVEFSLADTPLTTFLRARGASGYRITLLSSCSVRAVGGVGRRRRCLMNTQLLYTSAEGGEEAPCRLPLPACAQQPESC